MQVSDFVIVEDVFNDCGHRYSRYNVYTKNTGNKINSYSFNSKDVAQWYLDDFVKSENNKDLKKSIAKALTGKISQTESLDKKSNYKFCEDLVLKEIKEHIDSTYNSHYADEGRKIQAIEFLMDQPETAFGMLKGNAQKYLPRYGKKAGKNRKDLLKTIHYSMLLLYYDHYRENEVE